MASAPRSSVPLNALDSLQIPVRVTKGIAPDGRRRPNPGVVRAAHSPWPGSWPPPDGWYDVSCTWREILDAAISVGRDPTPWLSRFPALAANELLARMAPLAAYLHNDGSSAPITLRASPVYSFGAERSAQGAMAYRLGMTMTEWVARSLVGLPATTHHEDAQPTGAGPDWFGPGRRPDLWSEDATRSPTIWSFEAKAARRLAKRNMREGALQLAGLSFGVLPVPHARVLVGTSIDDQLFTLVEHETLQPTSGAANDAGTSLFNLARARLIVYLFLASQGHEQLRTVSVARGETTDRFSETDDATREFRGALISHAKESTRGPLSPDIAPRAREFVTARIPGTGMRIGLSPGLFRACQEMLASLQATIAEVAAERREWASYVRIGDIPDLVELTDEQQLDRVARFKEAVGQRTGVVRRQLLRGYEVGEQRGLALLDYPERVEATAELAMYSHDTYVGLDRSSVLMGPVRRA